MRWLPLLIACNAANLPDTTGNATGGATTGGTTGSTTGGTTGGNPGGLLSFAVFGDSRPPSPDDTAGYPTQIVTGIFTLAQQKGAQFVVGTGDYMFASTSASVTAQGNLLLGAEANFQGPVYHTLGNHECTGATASNCPNGNETANIQFFMSHLVPSGTTTPWYRVDADTPMGKARFLFIAENAWSPAQNSWLQQELADTSATYTFVVRHEPDNGHGTGAPGLIPTTSMLSSTPHTLLLEGHSHEYYHAHGT